MKKVGFKIWYKTIEEQKVSNYLRENKRTPMKKLELFFFSFFNYERKKGLNKERKKRSTIIIKETFLPNKKEKNNFPIFIVNHKKGIEKCSLYFGIEIFFFIHIGHSL